MQLSGKNRESAFIAVFVIFIFIVIYFVAGESRGDISIGFLLGLAFSWLLTLFKKGEN